MMKEDFGTYSKMATSRHSTEDRNKVKTNHTKSSRIHNSQMGHWRRISFPKINSRKYVEPTAPSYEVAMMPFVLNLNCK